MLSFSPLAILLAYSLLADAQTAASKRLCYNVSLPITVTSENFLWGLPKFTSNVDVTALNANFNRRDYQTTFNPFAGAENVTATYQVSGTLCEPAKGQATTLLIATHGGSFDRSYWDIPYQPSNYSFAQFATNNGYSIFFYDRIGSGQSTITSGYTNQLSIQIAILHSLITLARTAPLTPLCTHTLSPPSKIVLLGHSIGSILTNALLASNPTIADGAILSGWGFNSGLSNPNGLLLATWQPKIANLVEGEEGRWGGYDSGWITYVDILAYINAFFKIPFYDMKAVEYASDNSWPVGIMEVVSAATLSFAAPGVTAPIQFLLGEYDYFMCGGYCPGVVLPAAQTIFPNSVGFEAYIQPNTGHVINYALNATGSYQAMINFLVENGL